jgi:uncharacterized protein YecT (DUF1311 family)
MKKLHALVFAALISLSGIASAFDTDEIEREHEACISQDSTTSGMRRCVSQFYEVWDGLLNLSYKELMSKLDRDGQQKLREAQRAWIKFRDLEMASMDSIYSQTQGTMYLVVHAGNVMDITKARAIQLDGYLADLR